MRLRLGLVTAGLVVASVAVGSSAASAATLYTTAAHTSAVPLGTTFTAATATTADYSAYRVLTGTNVRAACNSASLTFQVTQNSGGIFKAQVTGGAHTGCIAAESVVGTPSTLLQVGGSSVVNGTGKAWASTSLTVDVQFLGQFYFGSFSGATGSPLAHGVFAQQPTTGTPVSVALNDAGDQAGLSYTAGHVTSTYTFTGAAANYSLN